MASRDLCPLLGGFAEIASNSRLTLLYGFLQHAQLWPLARGLLVPALRRSRHAAAPCSRAVAPQLAHSPSSPS